MPLPAQYTHKQGCSPRFQALISLNDMYNKLAAAGRPVPTGKWSSVIDFYVRFFCVHAPVTGALSLFAEAEFRAYHLLSLMGQHGKFKGDQQGFLSMLQAC